MQQVATYNMKPLLKLTKKWYCSLLQHFAIILETPHLWGVLHTKKSSAKKQIPVHIISTTCWNSLQHGSFLIPGSLAPATAERERENEWI